MQFRQAICETSPKPYGTHKNKAGGGERRLLHLHHGGQQQRSRGQHPGLPLSLSTSLFQAVPPEPFLPVLPLPPGPPLSPVQGGGGGGKKWPPPSAPGLCSRRHATRERALTGGAIP